jgi:AraC-like DNA-binding protein
MARWKRASYDCAMNPIQLSMDGNVEILVRATTEAFEPTARLFAQVIADRLGLERDGAGAAAAPLARLPRHKLERVRAFVEENYARRLRVEDLAAVVHMSPFHFTRLFKQASGIAPHAYLTSHRVERAKRLLAESGLALVDVAARVGYQTQGHFTEVFRRHVGATPRRFRIGVHSA